jgi:hypothetical protein
MLAEKYPLFGLKQGNKARENNKKGEGKYSNSIAADRSPIPSNVANIHP